MRKREVVSCEMGGVRGWVVLVRLQSSGQGSYERRGRFQRGREREKSREHPAWHGVGCSSSRDTRAIYILERFMGSGCSGCSQQLHATEYREQDGVGVGDPALAFPRISTFVRVFPHSCLRLCDRVWLCEHVCDRPFHPSSCALRSPELFHRRYIILHIDKLWVYASRWQW